jgi:hypothetical protein
VEVSDPSHPARRQALAYKLRLQEYFLRQARAAGAAEPKELAEQLAMLFDGANAFVLVRGTPAPASLLTAVRALVEAQLGSSSRACRHPVSSRRTPDRLAEGDAAHPRTAQR